MTTSRNIFISDTTTKLSKIIEEIGKSMVTTIEEKNIEDFPETKPKGETVTAISHNVTLSHSKKGRKNPVETVDPSKADLCESGLLNMGFEDVVFDKIKISTSSHLKEDGSEISFEEHAKKTKLFHGKDLLDPKAKVYMEKLEEVSNTVKLNSEDFCLLLKKFRDTPSLTIASALCGYDVSVAINRSNGGKWVNETSAFTWRRNIPNILFKVNEHTRTECSMVCQDIESKLLFEVSSSIDHNCTNKVKLAHPKIMLFWDCVKQFERLLKLNGLVRKEEKDLETVLNEAENFALLFDSCEKARQKEMRNIGMLGKPDPLLDETNVRTVANLVYSTKVSAENIYSRSLFRIDRWGKAVTSVDSLIDAISMYHDMKILDQNEDVCSILGRRSDTGQTLKVEATRDDIVETPDMDVGFYEETTEEKLLGVAVKALTKMCFPELLTGASREVTPRKK